MHVRKRIFAFLFAALVMALLTACGKWDYSREAMKAANDAQGENVRVTFEIDQKFTSSLRGAAEDNIQPADVKNAMAMDKTIEKLLTAGYRLDIYALRADIDAAKAAAQLADEFVSRLAGCEEKAYISMVKADNGYFYEAVLVYRHGGNGGAGAGSDADDDGPSVSWVTYVDGVLTFNSGAGNDENVGAVLGDSGDEERIVGELAEQGQLPDSGFSFLKVEQLYITNQSGITTIGASTFSSAALTYASLTGVKTIEPFAFSNSALATVENTDSIETVENGAFQGTDITSISLPNVAVIGGYACSSCQSLSEVSLPKAAEVGELAFFACNSLTSVSLCNATTIGNSAFEGCDSLYSVELPKVKTIEARAFADCLKLEQIRLGSSIESIGSGPNYNVFQHVPVATFTVYYGSADLETEDDDLSNALRQSLFDNCDRAIRELPCIPGRHTVWCNYMPENEFPAACPSTDE